MGLRQLHRGQVHRLSAGCATRTHHRRRDGSQSSALPESVLREAKRVGVRTARLVAILSVLMAIAAPAKADDFASLVGRLAGDSFADKEKAVTALGAQEDPRAVSLLRALTAGHLLRAPDGRVVVSETAGGTTRLRDAVTGEDITGTDPDSLDRIIVNNRLRGDIEATLGALNLFSTRILPHASPPPGSGLARLWLVSASPSAVECRPVRLVRARSNGSRSACC